MGLGRPALLGAGAAAVVLALLGYAVLLAINLRGARGMPAVVAHGWAAFGALLRGAGHGAGAGRATTSGVPLLDHATALSLHIAFAAYGFMGLLALGLSYVLVPMFALVGSARRAAGASPRAHWRWRRSRWQRWRRFGVAPQPLRLAALALGGAAVALHLRLMRQALRGGMRRELGRSFTLVRIGWAASWPAWRRRSRVALDAPLGRRCPRCSG